MINNLYIFVPPDSSQKNRIEAFHSGLSGRLKLALAFQWAQVFVYSADQSRVIHRASKDGKAISLEEGRLQDAELFPRHSALPNLSQYKEPFSLVLINNGTEEVWFVRDTFGLSTFYYAKVDDCVAFSTNVKDILALFPHLRRVNQIAIAEYLLFNHVAGCNTIFADIRQLEVGTAALVTAAGVKIQEAWAPCFKPNSFSVDEAIAEIDHQLRDIVREQFEVAPSKSGLLLSGGIDSSLLCSYLAELTPHLPTFSVDVPNYERSEKRYFSQVSRHCQTRQSTIEVGNEQFTRQLHRAIWHMEEPLSFTNSIPLLLACDRAKANECDWLIAGEGSDGLFSGGMRAFPVVTGHSAGDTRSKSRQIVLSYAVTAPDLVRSILAHSYEIDLTERLRILEESARKHGEANYENMLQAFHLKTYSEKAPRRMYRMSAATSVVCVSPFLTKSFADLVLSVPFQIRNHNGVPKYPMVDLASRLFGESFAHRPKDGFNMPNSRWFRSDVGLGRYRSFLLEDRTLSRSFYDPGGLRKALCFRLENGEAPLDYLLWSTLNLELWMRMFIDAEDALHFEDTD